MSRFSGAWRRLATTLVGVSLALSAASPVAACVGSRLSGEGESIPPRILFTGTAVQREEPFSLVRSSTDMIAWTFAVDGVREGARTDRVVVRSPRIDASCGVEFELGQRYSVSAREGDGGLLDVWIGGADRIDPVADPPQIEGTSVNYLTWTSAGVLGLVLLVVAAATVGVVAAWRHRRAARPSLGALLIGLTAVLIGAPPAAACSVTRLATPGSAEDIAAADFAFTGTVVRVDEAIGSSDSFGNGVWTFVVDDVQKGQASGRVTITSSLDPGSCAAGFRLGERYAVFATRGDDGSLGAWMGDVAQIGPLADPPPVEGRFVGRIEWSLLLFPGTVVLALAAVVLAASAAWRGSARRGSSS